MFVLETFRFFESSDGRRFSPTSEFINPFDKWSEAIQAAEGWLQHHPDSAAVVIDCSSPTSTGVDYRCRGFVPLSIVASIVMRAADARRKLYPEMTSEGPA